MELEVPVTEEALDVPRASWESRYDLRQHTVADDQRPLRGGLPQCRFGSVSVSRIRHQDVEDDAAINRGAHRGTASGSCPLYRPWEGVHDLSIWKRHLRRGPFFRPACRRGLRSRAPYRA